MRNLSTAAESLDEVAEEIYSFSASLAVRKPHSEHNPAMGSVVAGGKGRGSSMLAPKVAVGDKDESGAY